MPLRLRLRRRRRKDEGSVEEPLGARLLLLAGRSPDEQFALLRHLGCLSPRGQEDRMGVIRLLSRLYEAQVARGYQPPAPDDDSNSDLAELWRQLVSPPAIGSQSDRRQLVRLQTNALSGAGYLDEAACRMSDDDAESWWTGVQPHVVAIRAEHDPIYAAIASKGNGKLKSGQRSDPLTCPHCGRPAPRGATYCVWCGRWLAARPT